MRSPVRHSLLWALLASILIHVAGMTYLAVTDDRLPQPWANDANPGLVGGPSNEKLPVNPPPERIRDLLAGEQRYGGGLTEHQKVSELERRAGQLQNTDSAEVQRMAAVVATAMGVQSSNRAFAPVAGAVGVFDPDSASLYDIIQRTGAGGQTWYERVYVDAAGRTLMERVETANMADSDLTAFNIFELARRNPNLRPLIDTVRRYAQEKSEN